MSQEVGAAPLADTEASGDHHSVVNTTDTHSVQSGEHTTAPHNPPLEGEALEDAVRHQIEYLLSREHLASDFFLVSQMNSEMFVPLATLAAMCTATTDVNFITTCVKKSTAVTLDNTGTLIKPNFKIIRNTVILRDIPSSVENEKVREIFHVEGCPPVVNLRPDIGDCWFVTFGTEEEALQALEIVRQRTFNGAPVKARIKSENILRSFSYHPGTATDKAEATPSGMSYGGYYPPMGYGYPPRGGWGRINTVNPPQVYQGDFDKDQRRGGRVNTRQRKEGVRKYPQASPPPAGGVLTGSAGDGRKPRRPRARKQTDNTTANKPSTSPNAPSQLQLGLAHFPPLGPSSNSKSKGKAGYAKDFAKFSREDLIGIVTAIDITKQKPPTLPDSVPPTIVLKEPLTELAIPLQHPSSQQKHQEEQRPSPDNHSDVAAGEAPHDPSPATGVVASTPTHTIKSPTTDGGGASGKGKKRREKKENPTGNEAKPEPKTTRKGKREKTASKQEHTSEDDKNQPGSRAQPALQTWAQVARPANRNAASPNTNL